MPLAPLERRSGKSRALPNHAPGLLKLQERRSVILTTMLSFDTCGDELDVHQG